MAYLMSTLKGDLNDITEGQMMVKEIAASSWFSFFPVLLLGLGLFFMGSIAQPKHAVRLAHPDAAGRRAGAVRCVDRGATGFGAAARGDRHGAPTGGRHAMEPDLAKIEQTSGKDTGAMGSAVRQAIPVFQLGGRADGGGCRRRLWPCPFHLHQPRGKPMQASLHCFLPVNILIIGVFLLGFFIPHLMLVMDVLNMIQNIS